MSLSLWSIVTGYSTCVCVCVTNWEKTFCNFVWKILRWQDSQGRAVHKCTLRRDKHTNHQLRREWCSFTNLLYWTHAYCHSVQVVFCVEGTYQVVGIGHHLQERRVVVAWKSQNKNDFTHTLSSPLFVEFVHLRNLFVASSHLRSDRREQGINSQGNRCLIRQDMVALEQTFDIMRLLSK